MTSPAPSLPPFENEGDLFGDDAQDNINEEEEDGEELFGDNMEALVSSVTLLNSNFS